MAVAKDYILPLVNDVLNVTDRQVKLFCKRFEADAIKHPALHDLPVTFLRYPFINQMGYLAERDFREVIFHRLTFTRPSPPQRGHFRYPVFPPVLRTLRFTVCLTRAIDIPYSCDICRTISSVNILCDFLCSELRFII